MANSVDLIIGSEAIKQIEKAISLLTQADQKILDISQSSLIASKSFGGINTPSGLDKAVSNTSNLNTQLEKQNAIITKLHADIAKKAEQSRLSEIKLQQAREKAFDSFEKNAQKEASIAEKTANAYNKTQAQINRLTVAYNDLALRKERYNNLSENEEMRLNTLQKVTEKYNGVLKATDSTIGKNQRNVGNYASGFNALGNSINQLTREAPAFANSMNTGFMAISNNIPALTDAISGIRAQNKALAAEGKPTESVLKQLAGALFSWNTVISVGVTLLTVYGGKLIDYVFNTDAAKKATDSLTNSMKLNQEQTQKNISNLEYENKIAIELAKKRGASEKEIHDLQIKLGVDIVSENEKNYNNITKRLDSFDNYRLLKNQGGNKAFLFLLDKFNGDVAKARNEYNRREKTYTDENRKILVDAQSKSYEEIRKKNNENVLSDLQNKNSELDAQKEANKKRLEDEQKSNDERLKNLFEANKKEIELLIAKEDAISGNEVKSYAEREDALKKASSLRLMVLKLEQDEQVRLAKGDSGAIRSAQAEFKTNVIKEAEDLRKKLKEINDKQINEEVENRKAAEKTIKEAQDGINEKVLISQEIESKAQQASFDIIDKKIAKLKELQKATDDYLSSFTSEFASNSGFGQTFDTFFKQIKGADGKMTTMFENLLNGAETTEEKFAVTFNAIAESAQEAFNFISNASQANFDKEYERLENQKEVALRFAGDSASAKAKIEEDAEKKKKEIAVRENKAKQKQALFNIAIDTAQAIVAALPNIPLSIAVGVLGATQLALVATQKIPQYFEGTDNHTGGLMLVNDDKGANFQEKVILPNGKEIMPEGRNILMNAPKGTKVLTHEQQIQQMLNERGISMSANFAKNNGMTAQEMDSIMEKHFANIQTSHISIDKSGFNEWNERNGNRTRRNENRVSRTGFKV